MAAKTILATIMSLFPLIAFSGDSIRAKNTFLKKAANGLYNFVKDFSRVDTSYIEPPKYNYTLMLQNTNTYEIYSISPKQGTEVTLAPQPSIKLGPYFGWRWIFLGYTFDLRNISNGDNKKELDLSLYSSQIGIDLFYRKTGDNYKIKKIKLEKNIDTRALENMPFDGLDASLKGFNIYYIFNHRKFSYPAAFNQSTVQRRSSGSALVGFGYTNHSLSIDWNKLHGIVAKTLGNNAVSNDFDGSPAVEKITYKDISFSGGYGYNWVFAHNWLFAASLSGALGYKMTKSDLEHNGKSSRTFSLKNFNLDGIGRFGIVWNNNKWFFGASSIIHSYSYRKQQFSALNIFGNLNIYIGFNFSRR